MVVLFKARVEFWWFLEKLAGKVWSRFYREEYKHYWLDHLTAFTYVKRKNAEHAAYSKLGRVP